VGNALASDFLQFRADVEWRILAEETRERFVIPEVFLRSRVNVFIDCSR
jgi:hypothetical protein